MYSTLKKLSSLVSAPELSSNMESATAFKARKAARTSNGGDSVGQRIESRAGNTEPAFRGGIYAGPPIGRRF